VTFAVLAVAAREVIGTVLVVIAARLAAIVVLGVYDRLTRVSPGVTARATRYEAPVRLVVSAGIVVLAVILSLQLWGADAFRWFEPQHIGGRLVAAVVTLGIAALLAILVWEGVNTALDRRLARLSNAGSVADSARLRSLLPLLRAALLCTIIAIIALTALSQIGIDITPLLAGAGIIGIAIGFGAQTLVRDIITGMFVLFENAIRIGDFVTVAGLSGTVERLSVRNIWLRAADGALQVIPFSAVTSITNINRGLGNVALSVTVAYAEDSERIAGALRGIAADMRSDPVFAPLMVGDLDLWIDAVKASGVTYGGLIPCTDAGRTPVQREFNRRLLERFKALGIDLAG
jgi:small-conductance mechanosensitive channel